MIKLLPIERYAPVLEQSMEDRVGVFIDYIVVFAFRLSFGSKNCNIILVKRKDANCNSL